MRNIKQMTNKGLAFVLMAGVLIWAAACSDEFLEVPATGQVSRTQLEAIAGLEGQLIGVYAAIDGIGGQWHGGSGKLAVG